MLLGLFIFLEVFVSKRHDIDMDVSTQTFQFGEFTKKLEKLVCSISRYVSKIYDSVS